MTDRHAAYLVVLDADVREDDAEHIINALAMVKGVADVKHVPSDVSQAIARERRDTAWAAALRDLARRGP